MAKDRHVTPAYVRVLITIIAGLLTVVLTAVAFWLSYEHLHDVAGNNGLEGERAWAWPATLDMFIVIGEVLILRASLLQRVDKWAWFCTGIGSVGSITLNVVGVGKGASALYYVVAAVPPVAALLAFGILMRQLHEAIKTYIKDRDPVGVPPVPADPPSVSLEKITAPFVSFTPDTHHHIGMSADIESLRRPVSRVRPDAVSRPVRAVNGSIPSHVRGVLSGDPDATDEDIRASVIDKFGPDTKADTVRKAINRTRKELES